MRLKDHCHGSLGEPIPFGWGVAYKDWHSDERVCYPFGVHWIVRLIRKAWYRSLRKWPTRDDLLLDEVYERGFKDGERYGRESDRKATEAETSPYYDLKYFCPGGGASRVGHEESLDQRFEYLQVLLLQVIEQEKDKMLKCLAEHQKCEERAESELERIAAESKAMSEAERSFRETLKMASDGLDDRDEEMRQIDKSLGEGVARMLGCGDQFRNDLLNLIAEHRTCKETPS